MMMMMLFVVYTINECYFYLITKLSEEKATPSGAASVSEEKFYSDYKFGIFFSVIGKP